jgi:hypothetical protein
VEEGCNANSCSLFYASICIVQVACAEKKT